MKGAVSAGDRLTAEVAVEILREGGNAVDSAVGACLVAPLAEPALTSVGGGGFLLAVFGGKSVVYDFFVDVPEYRTRDPGFYPVPVDFGETVQEFHIGAGSVAVPGNVAGLLAVHRDLGRMPFYRVAEQAIEYARTGVRLSPLQASFLKLLERIFTATEEARNVFAPSGRLVDEKTVFKNPDYADFLELLAEEGERAFYEGDVARIVDDLMRDRGGHLRKEDLERYRVCRRKPLKKTFRGREILTNPPPSSGGVLVSFSLALLEGEDFSFWGSPRHAVLLVESMKVTSLFRKRFVDGLSGDFRGVKALEDPGVMSEFSGIFRRELSFWGNTTHVSVIDGEGNGVSVTTTNGEGSGIVVPGTGIMLNNMLGEEDLNPEGFFRHPPRTRLPSMMCPCAVLKGGKPEVLLGSAGSNRIRSAILQTILNLIVFRENVESAVCLPRLHFENRTVYMEPGFPEETVKYLEKRYPVVLFGEKNLFFGGVQAVTSKGTGAGDPRRGGCFMRA